MNEQRALGLDWCSR
jgi:SAM-dependent methyltransferase